MLLGKKTHTQTLKSIFYEHPRPDNIKIGHQIYKKIYKVNADKTKCNMSEKIIIIITLRYNVVKYLYHV